LQRANVGFGVQHQFDGLKLADDRFAAPWRPNQGCSSHHTRKQDSSVQEIACLSRYGSVLHCSLLRGRFRWRSSHFGTRIAGDIE
jgi:hypothetical protein